MDIDRTRLRAASAALKNRLLELRTPDGYWRGQLSSSALSTATAAFALSRVAPHEHRPLIRAGLDWLADHQNPDGGWGDTVASQSNISTTMLCWAAFTAAEYEFQYETTVERARSWLTACAGSLDPDSLAQAVYDNYGKDRTFSVPILTMCAIAGRLGDDPWRFVAPLPFELAALPRAIFKWLNLNVVSYALPALIAMGHASFHNHPPRCRLLRWLRTRTRRRTLRILAAIQPANGGFLEAAPLTSFVAMSLAAAGPADDPVIRKCTDFLARTVRPDGSWPIDTDLATWLTTLAIKAFAQGRDYHTLLPYKSRERLLIWLLGQQTRSVHPYTQADPGGWAWTDLPGAVPDADDTAGALLAIHHLAGPADEVTGEAFAAVKWLLDLQNRDGGIPTFCKGWGRLPFDRSAADLTAHALAAWSVWIDQLPAPVQRRTKNAMRRAIRFLARNQSPDGPWHALWFGNENAPGKENPVYCTARVLLGLNRVSVDLLSTAAASIENAVRWLLDSQHADGSWGPDRGINPSIEETAVAADALASLLLRARNDAALSETVKLPLEQMEESLAAAANWLMNRITDDADLPPAPIGLYFARLWYFEKLYPLIFAASALQKIETLSCGIEYKG